MIRLHGGRNLYYEALFRRRSPLASGHWAGARAWWPYINERVTPRLPLYEDLQRMMWRPFR